MLPIAPIQHFEDVELSSREAFRELRRRSGLGLDVIRNRQLRHRLLRSAEGWEPQDSRRAGKDETSHSGNIMDSTSMAAPRVITGLTTRMAGTSPGAPLPQNFRACSRSLRPESRNIGLT
jgi:hypothetical protein